MRDVFGRRDAALTDEKSRRRHERGTPHVDVVVAQPEIDGHAMDGPLILRVEGDVACGFFEVRRRREQLERHWTLVVERIQDRAVRHEQVRAVLAVVARLHLPQIQSGFEVMRAGDVGQRDLLMVLPPRQRRIRRSARGGAVGRAVFQID